MENLVTVLLPIYKEPLDLIKRSLDSILGQTYKFFKLLIVFDGRDNKAAVDFISAKEKDDKRISHIINDKNMGLSFALNRGIKLIDTKYVARMDADDISFLDRLEYQLDFMENNPTVDLISSEVVLISNKGETIGDKVTFPDSTKFIKKAALYGNILNHPTFFGKTQVFKDNPYREIIYAEDYDFTCRLLEQGYIIKIFPRKVLYYNCGNEPSDKKKYLCSIIGETVGKYYRKKKLCKVDIKKETDEQTERVNFEKRLKSINKFNDLVNCKRIGIKSKFFIKAFVYFIFSNYIRRQLFYALRLSFLKKRYRKK